jgi:hypothetical protein
MRRRPSVRARIHRGHDLGDRSRKLQAKVHPNVKEFRMELLGVETLKAVINASLRCSARSSELVGNDLIPDCPSSRLVFAC